MKKTTQNPLSGKCLIDAIVKAADEKLAEKISIIEMNPSSGLSDYFIVCQGDTTVHTQAIALGILDDLKTLNTRPWHVEGVEQGRWILLDYSDVVIHVMLAELRDYYKLENLGNKK